MLERIFLIVFAALVAAAPAHARGGWGSTLPALERAGKPLPAGDYERTLSVSGASRIYEVHVPARAAGADGWPVVLDFHGGMGNAQAARRGTHFDAKADREGFLAVYPNGTGMFPRRFLTWNAGRCCGKASRDQADDVAFVRAILDDLPGFAKIDERRVFATGFSNGAMLSHRLGCELSERIAAIAPVSGSLELESCTPSRPVPVLHIHGTADQNCPYAGGTGAHSLAGVAFRGVPETMRIWRAANRVTGAPSVTKTGTATKQVWHGAADTVLITIEGQGHRWPSGDPLLPVSMVGNDVGALDATDTIWEFFRDHPKGAR